MLSLTITGYKEKLLFDQDSGSELDWDSIGSVDSVTGMQKWNTQKNMNKFHVI
jgi:hypothetical protein